MINNSKRSNRSTYKQLMIMNEKYNEYIIHYYKWSQNQEYDLFYNLQSTIIDWYLR